MLQRNSGEGSRASTRAVALTRPTLLLLARVRARAVVRRRRDSNTPANRRFLGAGVAWGEHRTSTSVTLTILRGVAAVLVIGLAPEVAGAALLAAELLTLDPAKLAARGNTYLQSGEPHLWAQIPGARTFVGFGLLLAGFTVQIGGYVAGDGSWLALLAVAVAGGAVLAGRLLADRVLAPGLYHRAIAYRDQRKSES